MRRGFAAVGLCRPKNADNIGSALRAAFCYEAEIVVIAGDRSRFRDGVEHGTNTPRAERHVPVFRCDDLRALTPFGATRVAIEIVPDAEPLHTFQHPARAFYIFGPENGSLDPELLETCPLKVAIPTRGCMNLGATVNVVLYDRLAKYLRSERKPLPTVAERARVMEESHG